MTTLATFQVGRLILGPPATPLSEPLGDSVGSQGGAAVPAARTAPQFQVALATYLNPNQTAAQGQAFRRALRSLLNNTPVKLQGFLYVVYSDDTEQNGWYVPDATTLVAIDKGSWKAVGLWQAGQGNWLLAGRRRSHREGREVWMKDLRTGLYARDALGLVVSTDFAALPSLELSVLPHGASNPVVSASGQVLAPVALPAGRDGGVCQLAAGQSDMTVISYERAEAALNLSDVVVYDRRGQITAPGGGPDTSWEEVYGPDYPWNWLTAGQANDCPVLDNGLVRVRYDATGTPGFRVDVWTGSAYAEQGKMIVNRNGDTAGLDDTWLSASLIEWTPDRAVIGVVLSRAADAYSRERVYVTVQRGGLGATFECYPALLSTGSPADVQLIWTPALNAGVGDLNNSVLKIDSQGSGAWTPGAPAATQNTGPSPGVMASTAGTGAGTGNSGQFPGGTTVLGNANFTTSENWVSILRYPTAFNVVGAYQTTLIALQAANAYIKYAGANSAAYGGGSQDIYEVTSENGAGYLQCQVQFSTTQAQQVMEAETMTLGTGTTATAADSATASGTGNNSTVANRTTDANPHLTKASWPNSFLGTFRVFARVRVAGGTGSFYAQNGISGGAVVTTTSTTYVWLDLGEITANGSTLEIHAWNAGGSNTFVDRVEAHLVQDRTRTAAIYVGSRDQGQSALNDSRALGLLVARV